ncbi:hypothetical protein PM10SUCC1_27450 [Propionigenium maris DSM 9537]|uniref:L,D-transpeptidase catalytic domain n=1 Tax=Propionigenium maris DSM 9537 TaxID=1123000 RepID=A0A9W6GP10_9FUSO|nr:murein L,D-transpeptidase catalytic domain family protein [Propionigenium maris]GLI57231.1 hypothetical protein PM10SUCC1_27450 [Propionigenium maris DSM 9537]
MKKSFLIISTLLLLLVSITSFSMGENEIKTLYNEMKLSKEISYDLFKDAMIGYSRIDAKKKKDVITIIDYSKPSTEERFYVLDLKRKEVIFKTYVSHGVNTGGNEASRFSNTLNSRQSSLGFFLTNETYYGRNGYSLRLDGLEKGINDRARERTIVIHGAAYATDDFIRRNGRLGRSWGCPALPDNLSKEVIDTIKNGSVLFVYGNDNTYSNKTNIL